MTEDFHYEFDALIKATHRGLESTGFDGDLSALYAGLYDLTEALDKIHGRLLPELIKATRNGTREEDALGIVVDLSIELDHMGKHCFDALDALARLREHFERREA